MKRRKTQLEEKLLGLGYYLESKDYAGKHSQITLSYTYGKDILFGGSVVPVQVIINQKRNEVLEVRVKNFKNEYLNMTNIEFFEEVFDKVCAELDNETPTENVDEVVEVVETIESN